MPAEGSGYFTVGAFVMLGLVFRLELSNSLNAG